MAAINDLLKQIDDPILRSRLEQEVARISKNKKFGLVFEEHIPECTPLYNARIKRGTSVAKKIGKINEVYTVLSIADNFALCRHKTSGVTEEIVLSELVAVAQFGEPIFPTLQPIDSVENAIDSNLWHALIEADNYHALQLLEYLYPKQVDCIYIDPPYNTGARDWKYNNDYVDSSDAWRHSKWISMIKKRLLVAKKILSKDGVLITTIDDNEYAHLWILLHDIFPELVHNCVTIQHNPGGTQGKKFSVTNEYAIYSYSSESTIFRKQHTGKDVYNLRRWGSTSNRYEGATCFYPVILDESLRIIGFGDVLDDDIHPKAQAEYSTTGNIMVWPIDINGTEKKWRYARTTVEDIKQRLFAEKRNDRIEIILRRESEPPKTIWVDPLFNAEAHGTEIIKTIIGGGFSFPKSIYAVHEALTFAVSGKMNALIVDFFAGSGTTLNAVNLLNVEDDGKRRCIMVTNNEVSESESRRLKTIDMQPGDQVWEEQGICRSVTWPRTKNSILGKREDDSVIEGEYYTTLTEEVAKARTIKKLDFVTIDMLNTPAKKKQLVSLLGKDKLAQSLVRAESKFIVSDKYNVSILFDDNAKDEWLEALQEQEHIREFYVVTQSTQKFNGIKDRIQEILGDFISHDQVKRPMSEGFPANVEYFKLDFLDKDSVSLGRQFREILPLLWMKSGAIGKRPEIELDNEPDMMILPKNRFAILVDETKYSIFIQKLAGAESIETVYFVTNSQDAFREMLSGVKAKHTFQLYRDYIDNFVIGSRRD